jgi:hypothetical protein
MSSMDIAQKLLDQINSSWTIFTLKFITAAKVNLICAGLKLNNVDVCHRKNSGRYQAMRHSTSFFYSPSNSFFWFSHPSGKFFHSVLVSSLSIKISLARSAVLN